MKVQLYILSVTTLLTAFIVQTDFLTGQKKYERVRTAITDKEKVVIEKLKQNGFQLDNFNILIVAYKAEDVLELFAKKKSETAYKKLITYDICARSGELGPKRKSGDNQVPEGFYHIDRFNPTSNFYLSLGLNYPNQSDKFKSNAKDLGGDIFIHGSCVTIGCLPVTDDKIKEIYLYAIYAKNNGQLKIPVYVFPFRMTEQNMEKFKVKFGKEAESFNWENIKLGYDKFEKEKKELNITVDQNGDYKF